MQHAYLARIGLTEEQASVVLRGPSVESLRQIYLAHIVAVPFENMGQHEHKVGDTVPSCAIAPPTLNLHETLTKIVLKRRGGFCWELNFAFAWLLQSLGYQMRMGNAFVHTPVGPTPGHLCIFVEDLDPRGTLLVDPGFGDQPREPVPVSTKDGMEPVHDGMIGDAYKITKTDAFGPRWTLQLERRRAKATGTMLHDLFGQPPPPPEPVPFTPIYLFNDNDDLHFECEEFKEGLAFVLHKDSLFSQKRFAVKNTPDGHIVQSADYVKWVVHGVETKREELLTEDAYRASLVENFGINL